MNLRIILRQLMVFIWLAILPIVSIGQDFLQPEKAFAFKANMTNPAVLDMSYRIAPDYYMYQERFSLDMAEAPWELSLEDMPAAVVDYDPTFERDMHLYYGGVDLAIKLPAWPNTVPQRPFTVNMTSQGCAKAGLCYPPMLSQVLLEPQADGYRIISQQAFVDPFEASAAATTALSSDRTQTSAWWNLWRDGDDQGIADALLNAGALQVLVLFFVLGLLLAFTPCVLPMVPVLSALIVGQSGATVTRRQGFVLSTAYVAGMSVVYTILGVLAGLSGAGLAAWLQTPLILGTFAILLTIFALAMFDIVRLEMPAGIQSRLNQTASRHSGGKITAAVVTGAVSALILGPCVAAPLAGALLYISYTGDVFLGGAALFAMAWGMGVPLILVGASAGSLLPKAGQWMVGVKTFFGVLLLATAWWMVNPVVPAGVGIFGWIVIFLLTAVLLGTFEALPNRSMHQVSSARYFGAALRRTTGLLFVGVALIWLIGLASGGSSLIRPLGHWGVQSGSGNDQVGSGQVVFERIDSVADLDRILRSSSKPVLLDFYADWCVSCKEMEVRTFSSPQVRQRMQEFRMLQADVTQNNADHRALLRRFNLFGPPGIVFFEAGGRYLQRPRVIGFQNAERFSETLDEVLLMTNK